MSDSWTPQLEIHREGYVEIVEAQPPDQLPDCLGVPRGSTRPCAVWERRRGGCWRDST